MSEQQKQRNSGKIIEAIIEKLLPWHRIKWLSVGQLSQTVRIRVVGMNVAVGLCPDESLFQVQFLEPATNPEDLHQIQRLEAILNGAKRDDAGNLTSIVCGVDKGIETPKPEPLAIPEGWRELEACEMPIASDMYEHEGRWLVRADDSSVKYEWYDVRHIRKIEAANPSETPDSSTWTPKVGDKVRVNKPGRIAHGKVGFIVEANAREFAVRIEHEKLTTFNLKAEHLELIEAKPTKWTPKIGDIVRINSPERVNHGKVGIVVDKRARTCDVASEVSGKWKAWGLTANELEFEGSQK